VGAQECPQPCREDGLWGGDDVSPFGVVSGCCGRSSRVWLFVQSELQDPVLLHEAEFFFSSEPTPICRSLKDVALPGSRARLRSPPPGRKGVLNSTTDAPYP